MHIDITIIVDGDVLVGKTSMLKMFIEGIFVNESEIWYEPRPFFKEIVFNRSYNVKFLELMSAKRFDHFRQENYKKADCLMIIFDLTEKLKLKRLEEKIEIAKGLGIMPSQIILVGNKADLKEDILIIYDELALLLVNSYIKFYVETSAKSGININEVFKLASIIGLYSKNLIQESEFNQIMNQLQNQIKTINEEDFEYTDNDIPIEDFIPTNGEDMKICSFCNGIIKFNSFFCPNCGKEQESQK